MGKITTITLVLVICTNSSRSEIGGEWEILTATEKWTIPVIPPKTVQVRSEVIEPPETTELLFIPRQIDDVEETVLEGRVEFNSPRPTRGIIQQDKNGNIWVGSEKSSLFLFDGRQWTKFSHNDSSQYASDMAIDAENRIWLISPNNNGGVYRFDGSQWVRFRKKENAHNQQMGITIAIGENGEVWVGGRYGNGLIALHHSGITEAYTSMLFRYDNDQWWEYKFDPGFHSITGGILKLRMGPKGKVWGNADTGLFSFDGNDLIGYPAIAARLEFIQQDLWVDSGKQTLRFDGENWFRYENFRYYGGYPGAIVKDAKGRIWTGNGWEFGYLESDVWHYWSYEETEEIRVPWFPRDIFIDNRENLWVIAHAHPPGLEEDALVRLSLAPSGTGINEESRTPQFFGLEQNYPNPFNASTQITIELAEATPAELAIYNLAGQRIATLLKETMAAGRFQVSWDGLDQAGHPVASGVYIYRLLAGTKRQSRRMMLLR